MFGVILVSGEDSHADLRIENEAADSLNVCWRLGPRAIKTVSLLQIQADWTGLIEKRDNSLNPFLFLMRNAS